MSRVLLIDDDQDDRHFFAETLKAVNPNVTCITAKSGQEAFTLLNSEKTLPNVIFLDINMPEMSGWEFLTKLKKDPCLSAVPVIIYSTSSHQRDVNIAEDLGALGFCTKPEEITDLFTILKFVNDNLESLSKESIKNSGLEPFKLAA